MKKSVLILAALSCALLFANHAVAAPRTPPPLAQGPSPGHSMLSAVTASPLEPRFARVEELVGVGTERTEYPIPPIPDSLRLSPPGLVTGATEVKDPPVSHVGPRSLRPNLSPPLIGFSALSATGRIPPDPMVAAGPNHLVVAVNSDWAVYSKGGSLLTRVSAVTWFQNAVPGVGSSLGIPYDPQVVYDHYAGRWILVYLASDSSSQSWILISVSASSDPTGSWCTWALEGNKNGGTVVNNWSDYPQLGFDNQAIYLGLNQYTFGLTPAFVYAKVRILPKSSLYACSSVSWWDFWDLRDPSAPSVVPGTVRPAVALDASPVGYLVSASPFTTIDYVTLWSISNPTAATPSITGANIPVQATLRPHDADQLGSPGGPGCPAPCLLDTGDGRMLSVVYRGGSLWLAHAVAGGSGNAYTYARYAKIDPVSRVTLQDQSLGADSCWSFYPALSIDASGNMILVFGRSCTTTYPGIRFSGRSTSDSSIQSSTSIRVGEASYAAADSSGNNRWGDYFRAATDPADQSKIWVVGQYSASPGNTWTTYVAQTSVTCSAPAIPTATNNGPITAGQTLQLSASSSPGASYLWSGPNSFSSTLQNPLVPNAQVGSSGTYSVTASFGDCTSLSASTSAAVTPSGTGCVASSSTLCLSGNRFRVTASWQTPTASGQGTAVSISGDTGYFWFFNSANLEMVVKVLDACGLNARKWVFAGGLTNVNVVLTVTDTQTGLSKTYTNPQNTAYQPIQDTGAFSTCP